MNYLENDTNENNNDTQYSDKDIQVSTQLAYMDFDSRYNGQTIGQIMYNAEAREQLYEDFMYKYNDDAEAKNASDNIR